ncbi:hypothetical protein RCL_jg16430.t1 [Rhizophagus clarus]|uniref:Uncharacterized protein n=1 Tax=Rhizophagus clarus TaxID=94130 RepID=A0A8H3M5J1_9GLOM|nr:hypothetical protein RCL_jg16430.t1 [Rhizophagus clarus]
MLEIELSETLHERILLVLISVAPNKESFHFSLAYHGFVTPETCPGRPKLLAERDKGALQRVVRSDRLRCYKEKKNWEEEWKKVVWSNESRLKLVELFGPPKYVIGSNLKQELIKVYTIEDVKQTFNWYSLYYIIIIPGFVRYICRMVIKVRLLLDRDFS